MLKVLIGLFIGGIVGLLTAALMTASKGEQKVKPRYTIDDSVAFVTCSDTLTKGKIVAVKGKVFKKYRVVYQLGLFNTACVWIKAKNIIRLAKEG